MFRSKKESPRRIGRLVLLIVISLFIVGGCSRKSVPEPEPYTVSGVVTDSAGTGIADVGLTFTGADIESQTGTTDADGSWEQDGLLGDVTVTPAKADHVFDPPHVTVSEARADVNFIATLIFDVAGTILDDAGDPVPEVEVSIAGAGGTDTVQTDGNGRWKKTGLSGTVTISAEDPAFTFSPASHSAAAAAADLDFTGTLKACNEGTPADAPDPCIITRVRQLQQMNAVLDGHYALGADIDAGLTADWNGGEGFEPVGSPDATEFSGSLDGRGHEITGLFIHRPSDNDAGLFGSVDDMGRVENLTLTDSSITGRNYVGGVAGLNRGQLLNVSAGGTVSGELRVGGIAGTNYGAIQDGLNLAEVTGLERVGGIAGTNTGLVSSVVNQGDVSGEEEVGGIIGYSEDGAVSGVLNEGTVTGNGDTIGGVVGLNEASSLGLATVTSARNRGAVAGGERVGGVVGHNARGLVEDAHNEAAATVVGDRLIGGLVGYNTSGQVHSGSNHGRVTGRAGSMDVGGVVGHNYHGAIDVVFNAGQVEGGNVVGGVVGHAQQTGAYLGNSYNVATVSGTGNVGGVIGVQFLGVIERVYNLGDVSGGRAGGIVALLQGNSFLEQSFSAGTVSGADEGGLVALPPGGTITDSYFDATRAPGLYDEAAHGRSTAELWQQSNYAASWQFGTDWSIEENEDYPELIDNPR